MIRDRFYNIIYKLGTGLIYKNVVVGNVAKIVKLTTFNKLTLNIGIALTEMFIKTYNENWNAVWILGKAYQRLGNHEKSFGLFRSVLTLNPEHIDTIRELSGECLALGRICEAEKYCRKAIEIDTNDPTLQSNLAITIALRGDIKDAILEAKSALIRDPNNQVIKNAVEFIQNIFDGKISRPDRIFFG